MFYNKKKNLRNLPRFTSRDMTSSSFISAFEKRTNAAFHHRLIDDFANRELIPLSHLTENDSKWILQIDLPGVRKKGVSVTVTRGHVIVKAKLEESYHISRHGHLTKFECLKKVTSLPAYVDTKKISARFKNGILTIIIPKITNGKKIPID
jgi:HSP20 family molecular chaperone IbpA